MALVVFDVNNKESFKSCSKWFQDVRDASPNHNIPGALCKATIGKVAWLPDTIVRACAKACCWRTRRTSATTTATRSVRKRPKNSQSATISSTLSAPRYVFAIERLEPARNCGMLTSWILSGSNKIRVSRRPSRTLRTGSTRSTRQRPSEPEEVGRLFRNGHG
jgi:hypothetical protein